MFYFPINEKMVYQNYDVAMEVHITHAYVLSCIVTHDLNTGTEKENGQDECIRV